MRTLTRVLYAALWLAFMIFALTLMGRMTG
jgi:hypothetical protein